MALAPAVEPPVAKADPVADPGLSGRKNPGTAGTRPACALPDVSGGVCGRMLTWIALIGGILLAAVIGSIALYRYRVPPHRRGLHGSAGTEICWAVVPVLMLIGITTAALTNL